MKGNIKDVILRSAFELFLENGYRATTIRSIAEKSGISHTLIMYHFNSKANLAGEICREYLRILSETVVSLPTDRLFSLTQNRILSYWTLHNLIIATHNGFGSLFIEYTQDETNSFVEKTQPMYPAIMQDIFQLDIRFGSREFENDMYLLTNFDSALGRLVYQKRMKCRDAVCKFLSLSPLPGMRMDVTADDVEGFIFRNKLIDIVERFSLSFGPLC